MLLHIPLLVALAGPAPEAPPKGLSLAVLHIKPENELNPAIASLLTDVVTQRMRDAGVFSRVINSKELETMMGFEQQKQALNCGSDSCIAEIVGAMGVDCVLTGSVGKIADGFLLNLRVIDSRRAAVLSSISDRVNSGGEKALFDAAEAGSEKILRGMGLGNTGLVAKPAARPAESPSTTAPARPGPSPLLYAGIAGAALGGVVAIVAVGVGLLGAVLLALPYAIAVPVGDLRGDDRFLAVTTVPSMVIGAGALLGLAGIAVLAGGGALAALGMRGGA